MGKVRPKVTGNCFQTAVDVQLQKPDWIIVHGLPLGRGGNAKGLRYPHAWLESPDRQMVFDTSLHEKGLEPYVDKQMYYDLGNILWTVTYDFSATRKQLDMHGHYGPWHSKLETQMKRLGI